MVAVIVAIGYFLTSLLFQTQGISSGDSGDLVTAAATMGVPHPPGYPLYTLIGYILNFIPLFTPAWRIALISSISHSIVLGLLYIINKKITSSTLASLFGVFVLGFNYLFFLYSVTPEVFALLDLFICIFLLLCVKRKTFNEEFFSICAFVFGLSLSHHHLIVFIFPSVAYLIFSQSNFIKFKKNLFTFIFKLFALFMLGISVYSYVFIAAKSTSVINWDHVTSIERFVRLITRADYGTFTSGPIYGATPTERLLEIKAFFEFIYYDFRLLGICISLLGLYWLYKNNKTLGIFLVIGFICFGPFFFFYASFPLVNNFILGTYERFLLPSYLFICIFLSAGFVYMQNFVSKYTTHFKLKQVFNVGFILLIFCFPLIQFYITTIRFSGFSTDKTSDNLGYDILSPLDNNSIVLLNRDTVLFNAQYVRYALGFRNDLIVLHVGKLDSQDYQEVVKHAFPSLQYPPQLSKNYYSEFIRLNISKHSIYSYSNGNPPRGYSWVPFGLIYKLYQAELVPSAEQMHETNVKIWNSFHNPLSGILSRYNHLMIGDVPDVYAASQVNIGKILLKADKPQEALSYFLDAVKNRKFSDSSDALLHAGVAYSILGNCKMAINSFDEAIRISPTTLKDAYIYKAYTYRDCSKDNTNAQMNFKLYESLMVQTQTPLK